MGHRAPRTFSRSQAESASPAPGLGVLHSPAKEEEEHGIVSIPTGKIMCSSLSNIVRFVKNRELDS